MKLKIQKRSLILQQVVAFVLLSPLYLMALQALSTGYSPFSSELLLDYLKTNFLVVPLAIFCAWGVWHGRAWSGKFFVFFVILMGGILSKVYMGYQDKTVLFLLFFYLLLSLGAAVIWIVELSRVIYHPGFHYRDLGLKSAYPIRVEFCFPTRSIDTFYHGYLSNWDSANCFIVPEEELTWEGLTQDCVVEMRVVYESYNFEGRGMVISSYGKAFGVAFLKDIASSSEAARWSDFYDIMSERGIIHSV